MALLLYHLVSQLTRTHHDAGEGIEQLATEQNAIDSTTTEAKGLLASIHLRHNLAKEQQEEGEQNGNEQELQPPGIAKINGVAEEIGEQHNDGDIDQVVGYQDGSQRTLRLVTQLLNLIICLIFLFV